jgi:hypothetical protein
MISKNFGIEMPGRFKIDWGEKSWVDGYPAVFQSQQLLHALCQNLGPSLPGYQVMRHEIFGTTDEPRYHGVKLPRDLPDWAELSR